MPLSISSLTTSIPSSLSYIITTFLCKYHLYIISTLFYWKIYFIYTFLLSLLLMFPTIFCFYFISSQLLLSCVFYLNIVINLNFEKFLIFTNKTKYDVKWWWNRHRYTHFWTLVASLERIVWVAYSVLIANTGWNGVHGG